MGYSAWDVRGSAPTSRKPPHHVPAAPMIRARRTMRHEVARVAQSRACASFSGCSRLIGEAVAGALCSQLLGRRGRSFLDAIELVGRGALCKVMGRRFTVQVPHRKSKGKRSWGMGTCGDEKAQRVRKRRDRENLNAAMLCGRRDGTQKTADRIDPLSSFKAEIQN